MNEVKGKLLEAVGEIDIQDIGEAALVDILVNKIRALEQRIKELHGENAHERLVMQSDREALKRERTDMLRNPAYGAHGQFFFMGRDDRRYMLTMTGGRIESFTERWKGNDWLMQTIGHSQWEKL